MGTNLILGIAIGANGGVFGPTLDFDFVNNTIIGTDSIASALSVTRSGTAYADDSSGAWSSFSANTLRRTNKGLKIEGPRTNSIRNNSAQGAANPSTLPTNWGNTALAVTMTVIGTGTENGVDYIDLRFNGTPSSTAAQTLLFNGTITDTAGDTVANSIFLKLVSGTFTNTSQITLRAGGEAGGTAFTPTSTLTRYQNIRTLASTDAQIALRWNYTDTVTPVDFTIRIGWPQTELTSAFITSPVRTTSATVQRSADDVTLLNPTNYVSLSQGSAFIEWDEVLGTVSVARRLWSYRVDANNIIYLEITSGNKVSFNVVSGGVSQASLASTNNVVAGTRYRAAVRWGANDFAARYTTSLGSPANDTSGAAPTGSPAFYLGQDGASGAYLNENIRLLKLFVAPQGDSQLAAFAA